MKVRGFEWTTEGQIIAALVLRLGGSVELTTKEICQAEGLIIAQSLQADDTLCFEASLPDGSVLDAEVIA